MELFFMAAMAIFALLFGGVFVLLGVLLVGAGLATVRGALTARHWPQVFAAIESSTVETVTRLKGTRYRPVVTYAFSTATGNFTSKRIGFAERLYATEAAARKVAARYPAGTTVMARCNPDDPTEAVLVIRWIDGGAILCFGLLCWSPDGCSPASRANCAAPAATISIHHPAVAVMRTSPPLWPAGKRLSPSVSTANCTAAG